MSYIIFHNIFIYNTGDRLCKNFIYYWNTIYSQLLPYEWDIILFDGIVNRDVFDKSMYLNMQCNKDKITNKSFMISKKGLEKWINNDLLNVLITDKQMFHV